MPPIAGRPGRPPGWRPPGSRPPSWRPPPYRPPYVRPPHWRWGRYYWYPRWGWYHTAIVAGATLVYVTSLPNQSNCQTVQDPDGTLYTCDGVIYRPTYYQDEQVYEVVSAAQQPTAAASGSADNDQDVQLQLSSPMLRGERVRALQNALNAIGFDVGRIDAIFGNNTQRAVREFQEWYGLPVTGIVDDETAAAIGQAYATTIAPDLATYSDSQEDLSGTEPTLEPAIPAPENGQAGDGTGIEGAEQQTGSQPATAAPPSGQADDSAGNGASEQQTGTEPAQEPATSAPEGEQTGDGSGNGTPEQQTATEPATPAPEGEQTGDTEAERMDSSN